jgi:hypothetical protein
MYGIHRAFPFRRPADYLQPTDKQIARYNAWSTLSGWLLLLFFALSVYLVGGPLRDHRVQSLQPQSTAVFYVLPDRMYWYMIGWIPVLGLSAFVYTLSTKIYLGNDYKSFIEFYNQKVGYNAFRAFIPICGGFALLGFWLMFCLWNYSIYAYQDKMVVHWFVSANAKTYTYKQVKKIEFTPETQKQGTEYTLTFDDGQDWNSPTALEDPNAARDFAFISKQSGVKIDTLKEGNP